MSLRHVWFDYRRYRLSAAPGAGKISEAGRASCTCAKASTADLIHQLPYHAVMQERGVSKAEASAETGYGLNRDYGVALRFCMSWDCAASCC
jgi:hypothetical protein